MSDILARIVEATREDLRARPVNGPVIRRAAEERAVSLERGRFSRAIDSTGRARIIAEIKAASPSAGTIIPDPDIELIAREYRTGGAAALSIVTEPKFFHGSREWLLRAASGGLPVIMKDFVIDPLQLYRGVAEGADAILLLASLLDPSQIREFIAVLDELRCDALVEVHDESELAKALDGGARMIGVNNRNLRDFTIDLATSERLSSLIPAGIQRVAESGIRTSADIARLQRAGFHAFLVGESLLRSGDRLAALRELCGAERASDDPNQRRSVQPKVKICGITRVDDARAAVEEGASFLGLVFANGSSRLIDAGMGREIAESLRGRVELVGVFRDDDPTRINDISRTVGLDLVQLHGNESDDTIERIERPVIKAIHISGGVPETNGYAHARWLMFDTSQAGRSGGTGVAFDWTLLSGYSRTKPFFLAGGLNAGNIAQAIRVVGPDAVDVSTGVEDAPGIKSQEKMRRLFAAVREAK